MTNRILMIVGCVFLMPLCPCNKTADDVDYREEMRTFVQNISDLFYEGSDILSAQDIAYLKEKSNGGARLVLTVVSGKPRIMGGVETVIRLNTFPLFYV